MQRRLWRQGWLDALLFLPLRTQQLLLLKTLSLRALLLHLLRLLLLGLLACAQGLFLLCTLLSLLFLVDALLLLLLDLLPGAFLLPLQGALLGLLGSLLFLLPALLSLLFLVDALLLLLLGLLPGTLLLLLLDLLLGALLLLLQGALLGLLFLVGTLLQLHGALLLSLLRLLQDALRVCLLLLRARLRAGWFRVSGRCWRWLPDVRSGSAAIRPWRAVGAVECQDQHVGRRRGKRRGQNQKQAKRGSLDTIQIHISIPSRTDASTPGTFDALDRLDNHQGAAPAVFIRFMACLHDYGRPFGLALAHLTLQSRRCRHRRPGKGKNLYLIGRKADWLLLPAGNTMPQLQLTRTTIVATLHSRFLGWTVMPLEIQGSALAKRDENASTPDAQR